MTKKDKKLIRYTDRDFSTIKQGLINHAKRYYPDSYRDFSEASFGSLMLDTVSYVGDILSFYLDYQANESFLDTATEYDNILRLGEQVGYREPLKTNSFGLLTMYILCPADSAGTAPDTDYLPILAKDSKFSSAQGQLFTLLDDIDFANPNNQIVVATSEESDGSPTSFAVRAYGRVISGETKQQKTTVGNFKRFLSVDIEDADLTEVVSVVDDEGHEFFEVDYLSQDTIFRSVVNKDADTRKSVPNVIVTSTVPRRFIMSNRNGLVSLKFGYGSESSLKTDVLSHPSNVVLKMHGKDFEGDLNFDPSKLLENDKFGISPANTTLTITYRVSTNENANVASRSITNVVEPLFVFREAATNRATINSVKDSIEVTNESPIIGSSAQPTVKELKQRINDVFATQNRAVTANDYEAIIYRMPSRFGSIKRAKISRDDDSFKKNLNLHLLSQNAEGHLVVPNETLKNNVKVWIQNYKMINDTIDIVDPKVINIGIKFAAVVDYDQDKLEALNSAITEIQSMFNQHLDIGQPIYITNIYDKLNNLEEIVDVTDVEIVNKTGGLYSDTSLSIKSYISADGRILYAPNNVVYELRYPNRDIRGTIK